MYRGTTPTIPIRVKGVDLTGVHAFLTFENPHNKKQLTLESPRDFTFYLSGEYSVAEVTFTQEQTLSLCASVHDVQIRWINESGEASATKKQKINVDNILLEGVINYA